MADDEQDQIEEMSIDACFAANLRGRREALGLSQDDLAQRMKDRQHSFSQAIIWKIETGQRPVRLSEAHDLAASVDEPYWERLTRLPEEYQLRERARAANRDVYEAYTEIQAATRRFMWTRDSLMAALSDAQDRLPGELLGGLDFKNTWNEPPEYFALVTRLRYEAEERSETGVSGSDLGDAVEERLNEFLSQNGWDYSPSQPEDWVSVRPEGS